MMNWDRRSPRFWGMNTVVRLPVFCPVVSAAALTLPGVPKSVSAMHVHPSGAGDLGRGCRSRTGETAAPPSTLRLLSIAHLLELAHDPAAGRPAVSVRLFLYP